MAWMQQLTALAGLQSSAIRQTKNTSYTRALGSAAIAVTEALAQIKILEFPGEIKLTLYWMLTKMYVLLTEKRRHARVSLHYVRLPWATK